MKIEEAIEWMEETIQDINELFDQCSTALQEEITEQKEVFELALTALRSMPEAGEPLSLEQLREMDGKPVWVEFIGHPDGTPIEPLWMLVNCRERTLVTDVEYVDWNFEGWFAYSYPPAHIDRSEWISVKERLPEAYYGESDNVLVVDEIGIRKILYFDGGCWCYPTGETYDRKVTHWMPLPEPPEEG